MKSIASQIEAIAKRSMQDVEDIAHASMLRLGNLIVQGSAVDKGRFINNWMSSIGTIDASTTEATSVSGADSIGRLNGTINGVKVGGASFYFTNTLPYSQRLEYEGWSAKMPQGTVRINALKWDSIVQDEISKRAK